MNEFLRQTPHWIVAPLITPKHPFPTRVCPPLFIHPPMHPTIPLVSSPLVPTCFMLDLMLGVFHSYISYTQDMEMKKTYPLEEKRAFTFTLVETENGKAFLESNLTASHF